MPYIKRYHREFIDQYLFGLVDTDPAEITRPADCGELNYALTMTVLRPMVRETLRDLLMKIVSDYLVNSPLRYQRINDAVGACECAALELDRRHPQTHKFEKLALRQVAQAIYSEIGVPYERTKIAENGDIEAYRG